MNDLFNMVQRAINLGTSLMIGYADQCAVMHHRIFPIEFNNDEKQRIISIKGKSHDLKEMFNFSYADATLEVSKDKRAVDINYNDGKTLAIYDPKDGIVAA